MFARFDENPEMTLRVIKKTKRYGCTHGKCENSIPTTNKVCGGYKKIDMGRNIAVLYHLVTIKINWLSAVTLTLFILMDFLIHVYRINMELPILYFKGLSVVVSQNFYKMMFFCP